MSDSGLDLMTGGSSGPGRRRASTPPSKPWGRRIVTLLVILALVLGGYFVWTKVSGFISGPADYSGTGTGSVTVEIPQNSNGQQIADILAEKDVVKSAEAFYQLALKDSRFQAIQAGYYKVKKQMSAEAAMKALSDKRNIVGAPGESRVTIPEGSRIKSITKIIAARTKISAAAVTKALKDPDALGLPAVAKGNPEGYLFPATYSVGAKTTATQLLKQMVAKTLSVAKDLDIGTRARALGLDGEQVLTVASILEYEAKKDSDYPKVARVLYNRLKAGMLLQLDSTVSYASGREGDVFTTQAERDSDSPYNTYKAAGLPPGPIGSPGEKTIEAALNPADGDWLYFVAVNLETGETVFSNTKAEHDAAVLKLQEYCRSADAKGC
ncbi:endolytic transglycosylase MltG [Aeromicrobium ginsengisoli]|uniref:Endolytic murein transglycosylase n=1 Tax=Aeromicrobium ginsengisoli TaxID=363867 RepID=A0A5M4FGA8_9ACTN|nr:endolytic transglycosylase MltG [Aeromicrobium ginsengisoli]KAA1399259.1 endolytic transglycosylase MltG [Aeromicrobium ginsengisoli]